jgi:uncharacterized protein YecE (DUF72 family)
VRGHSYVGTSGFAYKQWKPGFYPEKLKAADMLRYYAERLPSVEINNTFYRMPSPKLVAGWRDETPESFRFTLKAPQRITHVAKLAGAAELVERFLDAARTLGPRRGCLLFQCPPWLRYEASRLDDFLAVLPDGGLRFAMEFRHESWDVPEVKAKLAARNVAWCTVDGDEGVPRVERTAATFVYLRLRRSAYDDRLLDAWSTALAAVVDGGADAYVYFKHEDDPSGVRYADRLLATLGRT